MSNKRPINWFRLNRELHRDLGYFAFAMTVLFAVSGITLNHLADWNSNYIVEREQRTVSVTVDQSDEQINQQLLSAFAIKQPVKASYWESVNQYKLFFDNGGALTADLKAQTAVYENIRSRPILKQFNSLHLNEVKAGWIIFSDLYAGLLLFLAISGLFMVKGKYSPWHSKRGWLLLLGTVIPCVYVFIAS
ncbi:PepSY-associated TM helix domain-containing protein [Shewanella maritima]|nr:PepSY-associated TM helix domain-containing protein [Shewanella maritima]